MSNDVQYTTVDLNATGGQTVYDPDHDATVYAVHMTNPGGTAEIQLEVTDGTDTVIIQQVSGAGDNLHYNHTIALDGDQSLQINVTTAEGTAGTSTAAVSAGG